MSRVLVIVVVCLSTTSALRVVGMQCEYSCLSSLDFTGVNTVPLAGDANAPWVLEEQRAASGPLGMHLTRSTHCELGADDVSQATGTVPAKFIASRIC